MPVPVEPLPAAPLVLQYDGGAPRRVRRLELALFLPATLAGAVAPFLPFTWGVAPYELVLASGELIDQPPSPSDAILYLFTLPFLLPILLLPYRLRVLLVGPASRAERGVAYVAAALFTVGVMTCLWLMARASTLWDEYAATGLGVATLCVGGLLFLRVALRGRGGDRAAMAALLVPYVANSAMVLFGFSSDRQVGWYVTLAAAGAGLAELVLLAASSRKRH